MMEWSYRRTEQATAATDDLIIIVSRVTLTDRKGTPTFIGNWQAKVMKDDGSAILMTADDRDRDTVLTACQDFTQALSLARERDPTPDDMESVTLPPRHH